MRQIGEIITFSGNGSPQPSSEWALCDGREVNDFITPDLVGRVPMGKFDGTILGQPIGGSYADGWSTEGHVLTVAQMPSHSHSFVATNYADNISGAGNLHDYQDNSTGNFSTGSEGGSQSHSHDIVPQAAIVRFYCYVGTGDKSDN